MPDLLELEARMQRVRTALLDAKASLDQASAEAGPLARFLPAEFFAELGQARRSTYTARTLAARK